MNSAAAHGCAGCLCSLLTEIPLDLFENTPLNTGPAVLHRPTLEKLPALSASFSLFLKWWLLVTNCPTGSLWLLHEIVHGKKLAWALIHSKQSNSVSCYGPRWEETMYRKIYTFLRGLWAFVYCQFIEFYYILFLDGIKQAAKSGITVTNLGHLYCFRRNNWPFLLITSWWEEVFS